MQATRRLLLLLVASSFAVSWLFSVAQVVTATLPVGITPQAVAVNPVTNKVYVANGNDNTVTVIDGPTNNTTTITVGYGPSAVAVNSVTNKIYVANEGDNTVTVIDGFTNNTVPVPVGSYPIAVAVNSATNKIYVTDEGDNTVTVIDGVTNNTSTVTVGYYPSAVGVNPSTNKIYVVNSYYQGTVSVIDGATNMVTTVTVGEYPGAVAVNSTTNTIYVVNQDNFPGTVTVIDGATNNTSTVTVGYYPSAVAVNSVTNKIYVASEYDSNNFATGSVTVIDGVTNNTTNIGSLPSIYYASVAIDSMTNQIYVGGESYPTDIAVINGANNAVITIGGGDSGYSGEVVAVNPVTNMIYVANTYDNTVSVITGNATLQFLPVPPCRVVDTRKPNGPFGGPPIQGGTERDFPIPQGSCNIPASAIAYALNVTLVPSGPLGYLTIWPTSQFQPSTSIMNSLDGRVKANAAIVQGGVNAAVSVFASNTTDVVLDINGYFATTNGSTLAFFSLPPCRVADTRNPVSPLGGPSLSGGQQRDFPVLDAPCNIPSSAQAYSLNFTVVPPGPLGYLTVWPTGQTQPGVSTLNAPTGTIVANAAIVPAGASGDIDVFASNNTDLVIDINGYFAPANSGPNPLSLYPLNACRTLDTRFGQGGWFSGEYVLDVVDGYCAVSPQAQAYAFNATVIPRVSLGYLTLWPDGAHQPSVSTLNAVDGAITSNMAIVPTTNGLIDAYSSNLTQLILDISGYFAP